MPIAQFFFLIAVFIVLMLVYKYADRFIKRLDPATVKKINWVGFAAAVAGGVAWYFVPHIVFMAVTLAGVIVYFLFYGYDRMEKNGA